MRKLVLLLFVLVAPGLRADDCTGGQNYTPVTFASEKITVSSTAIGFTRATYAPSGSGAATQAFCSTETDQLRFLTTGAAPTTTTGVLVAAGNYVKVCLQDMPKFLAIRVTTDVPLNCEYMRPPE